MRTYEEITAELHTVAFHKGSEALRSLVVELRSLGTPQAEATAQSALGHIHWSAGDYPAALEHYQRALQAFEALGERADAARVTGNIGMVYRSTGDYERALDHYSRALQEHLELGNRSNAARVMLGMGNVCHNTGDFPRALEYYHRALQLHEDVGNRPGTAIATDNIGSVYRKTGEHERALEFYGRALHVHKDVGNRAGAAIVTGNMASVLLAMGRDDEAAELLERQAVMVMNRPDAKAEHHSNRALLAEHSEDLDEAWNQLREALVVVTEAGLRDHTAECHKRLRDLAQKRNDFAGYVEHNTEYMRITDEVKGRESTQRLAMIEAERRMEGERREREKERALLFGALPESVANRLLRGEDVSGDHIDSASVLFLDIAGFTSISDRLPPGRVVQLLKGIFKVCDDICRTNGLTKIKTIGDSYMAAAFPDTVDLHAELDHVERAAHAALEMITALAQPLHTYLGDLPEGLPNALSIRIGLHIGPLTAGIIGTERIQYDVWGDTVNVASRMESTGEVVRIQVSSEFHEQLSSRAAPSHSLERGASEGGGVRFWTTERGAVEVQGKGTMTTYWLEGA